MIKIIFNGLLEKYIGHNCIEIDASTFKEGIQAIEAVTNSKLQEGLQKSLQEKISYEILVDGKIINQLDSQNLQVKESIEFMPKELNQNGTIDAMIVLAVISIALQLAQMFLLKQPKLDLGSANSQNTRRRENYLFDGKAKPVVQGNPVPVGYGRMMVQPTMINSYVNIPEATTLGLRKGRYFYQFRYIGDNSEFGRDSLFAKKVVDRLKIDGLDLTDRAVFGPLTFIYGQQGGNIQYTRYLAQVENIWRYEKAHYEKKDDGTVYQKDGGDYDDWQNHWPIGQSQNDCYGRSNNWKPKYANLYQTFFGEFYYRRSQLSDWPSKEPLMNLRLPRYVNGSLSTQCATQSQEEGLLVFTNYVKNDKQIIQRPANFSLQVKIEVFPSTIDSQLQDIKIFDSQASKTFIFQPKIADGNDYGALSFDKAYLKIIKDRCRSYFQEIFTFYDGTVAKPLFSMRTTIIIQPYEKIDSYNGATNDLEPELYQIENWGVQTFQIERDCGFLIRKQYQEIYSQITGLGTISVPSADDDNTNGKCLSYQMCMNSNARINYDTSGTYFTQSYIGKEFESIPNEIGAQSLYTPNLSLEEPLFQTKPIGRTFLFDR